MKTSIQPLLAGTEAHLVGLGERLRLARLRRQLSVDVLAAAAGISRVTVFRIEKGAASVAMGAYARVMEALGLTGDLELVAQADTIGRQLQDRRLPPRRSGALAAGARGAEVVRESAEDMWAFKRQNQRRDIEAIRAARVTNSAMSWFTEEQAVNAKIVGEPL